LDGAHFSARGLSDTGPFRVWAKTGWANARSMTVTIAPRMIEYRIDVSSSWIVNSEVAGGT
jgi:hypothetical protein